MNPIDVTLPSTGTLCRSLDVARAAVSRESPRHLAIRDAGGSVAALVARALRREHRRAVVLIVESSARAEIAADDLRFVLGADDVVAFDAPEGSPYSEAASDRAVTTRRLAALHALSRSDGPRVVVVSAAALARKVVPARRIGAHGVPLVVGEDLDRSMLLGRLAATGYLRVPLVEDPGTLSVRGGLIDVWGPAMPRPVRLEFDGDTLASLKSFDPHDQRSRHELARIDLPPAREAILDEESVERARRVVREIGDATDWPSSRIRQLVDDVASGHLLFGSDGLLPAYAALEPLFDQLPDDAVVLVEEPSQVAAAIASALDRAAVDEVARHGTPHFPLDALMADETAIAGWLKARDAVGLNVAPIAGDAGAWTALAAIADDSMSLGAREPDDLARALAAVRLERGHGTGLAPLAEAIEAWQGSGLDVSLIARTATQADRLATMLRHRRLDVSVVEGDGPPLDVRARGTVVVAVGSLRRSLVAPTEGVVWVTEEDIFGSRSHRERRATKSSDRKTRQLLEDLRDLNVGDFVVHVDHGIGRYAGLVVRDVAGQKVDLIAIEYAEGDRLYLPAYRLSLVQRYRGSEASPRLDKLGGQSFARTKSRAKARVRQMADELLKLYAERRRAVGTPTPLIDDDYRAFEAAFPFEETDDQARAIQEVGADLEAPRPMDRLVCGDVGFGKTEVAIRAAFRVAMSGRQVAVLCPTTILAQQHRLTFDQRMSGHALRIETLSRFQSTRRQREIVAGLRDGTIDVVLGTHRLLSKDVHFKNLGLLVVDEEQRFGVAAKERIKALRTDVDVLTLSATPIPRTLQMAVAGVRDLSIITTPPVDRRAVRTIATRWDPTVLGEAITRELARGGQVFYVFNRIEGLGERAQALRDLVPNARIAIAHGQMSEEALERVMLDFIAGDYDVLCSTAIVENGLDIPRCNTIIIDRADRFGLSQLYQLRGRVGRSRERGYCYLVVPGDLDGDARLRIEALQRYTELGSGFQVAALDLDLRGGGDLLGAEQSGTIASVGLEMFCSMLDEAVHELQGHPTRADIEPELSFDVEALLAEEYIGDVGVRLSLYKRLASALDREEVARLAEEMEDRFGRPPTAARRLIDLMGLKTELRRVRALACEASAAGVTLHLRNDTPLDPVRLTAMIRETRGQWRLSPDMRLTRRSLPSERFPSGIEATERLLDEARACES